MLGAGLRPARGAAPSDLQMSSPPPPAASGSHAGQPRGWTGGLARSRHLRGHRRPFPWPPGEVPCSQEVESFTRKVEGGP